MKIDYIKLNYKKIVVIITVLLIVLTIGSTVKPLLYNSNSEGKLVEDEYTVGECQYSLNRYFNIFESEQYNTLNDIVPLLRNRTQKTYINYASDLNTKSDIVITKIMKVGNKVYSIKYYFDGEEKINTIIMKISNNHFFVYYDSNIH